MLILAVGSKLILKKKSEIYLKKCLIIFHDMFLRLLKKISSPNENLSSYVLRTAGRFGEISYWIIIEGLYENFYPIGL